MMIREIPRRYLSESNRIVERLGDKYVLKHGCPRSSRTGGQNRSEGTVWDTVKHLPDASEYLAPVLDYDPRGRWLLMPLLQPVSKYEADSVGSSIEVWIEYHKIPTGDVMEYNMGKKGKRIVLLDYGYSLNYDWDDERGHCNRCDFCQKWDGSN